MRPLLIVFLGFLFGCSDSEQPEIELIPKTYNLLSLGDSYTIGEGVCITCNFPSQLKDSLTNTIDNSVFELNIIAQTGWTSGNLISAISSSNLEKNYDLVTLLIGVNNQFKGLPFTLFQSEFEMLSNKAISLAGMNASKVIVISIFDYSNTEFGNIFAGSDTTAEITEYNNFIKSYADTNDMIYIDAQNLIFDALEKPELIASDGLHPSEKAYTELIELLLPQVIEVVQN